MSKPNGYILSESENHVVIATGFADKSANLKTGNMIQIFILYKHENPYLATVSGNDKAVCFDCPLRPSIARPAGKTPCYVKTIHAPASIWKAYNRGNYSLLTDYSIFGGRKVRFGAYGEPVLIPFKIVREIAVYSFGWTGYTHQWKSPLYQAYKAYFMASCDESDYELANSMGWRAFIVKPESTVFEQGTAAVCPASKEFGKKLNCVDCLACSGLTGRGKKNIQINLHR
jgi:hypothetical protein